MKNKFIVLATVAFSVLAAPALADCPSSLNAQQMIDCIISQNAEYSYPEPNDKVTGAALHTDSDKLSQNSDAIVVAAHK